VDERRGDLGGQRYEIHDISLRWERLWVGKTRGAGHRDRSASVSPAPGPTYVDTVNWAGVSLLGSVVAAVTIWCVGLWGDEPDAMPAAAPAVTEAAPVVQDEIVAPAAGPVMPPNIAHHYRQLAA
jgi:hypothetical protein